MVRLFLISQPVPLHCMAQSIQWEKLQSFLLFNLWPFWWECCSACSAWTKDKAFEARPRVLSTFLHRPVSRTAWETNRTARPKSRSCTDLSAVAFSVCVHTHTPKAQPVAAMLDQSVQGLSRIVAHTYPIAGQKERERERESEGKQREEDRKIRDRSILKQRKFFPHLFFLFCLLCMQSPFFRLSAKTIKEDWNQI